jgi:glyoxylase I family protein
MHIDHTTFRTNRLVETRDFLIAVFDLVEGPRPATIANAVKGYWLYHKDWPLIHIIQSPGTMYDRQDDAAEAIDHVAFVLKDYDAFKQNLIDLKVPFDLMDVPEINIRRIFFRTPTGVLIETIFKQEG